MLQSTNELHGFTIHAEDGEMGKMEDLYFDDKRWAVRYVVVDTGKWLPGRRVLISPASVKGVDWFARTIVVSLTRDQVRDSPDVLTDQPVSRQHEEELSAYYGWPSYWMGDPFEFTPQPFLMPAEKPATSGQDPHLRSAHEIKGYRIVALDGMIGQVSDFVFNDATWEIALLIVDAGSWLHAKHVVLSTRSIAGIVWDDRKVTVNLSRETVEASLPFIPRVPISRESVERLLKYYDRSV